MPILLILLALIPATALSGPSSSLETFSYFEDVKNEINLSDVRSDSFEKWTTIPGSSVNVGFNVNPFWVKSKLPACKSDSSSRRYLKIGYPPLDDIRIWFLDSSGRILQKYQTGDAHNFKDRPVKRAHYFFPTNCEAAIFIARIKTSGAIQIPVEILDDEQFESSVFSHEYTHLLYFGAALMISGYNFLLFIFIRKMIYLYYVCFVLSFVAFQSNLSGLGFQFLWPNQPFLNQMLTDKLISLIVLFGTLFSFDYLRAGIIAPKLANKQKYFIQLIIASIAVSFFIPYRTGVQIAIVFVVVSVAQVVYLMIKSVGLKHREGFIYSASWAFLLGGTLLVSFNKLGYVPNSFWVDFSQLIGSSIEMLMLSFGLADRVNALKSDLKQSNLQLNQLLSNIELIVQEKTREITAILSTISQGIFTISLSPSGKLQINDDYSNFLHELFGEQPIVGQDPISRIFEQTKLDNDKLAIIKQVLETSINNDFLQLQSNNKLLPNEIHKEDLTGDHTFIVDWEAILTDDDIVDKILVSVKDMTKYKNLEIQAAEQQDEVKKLIELASVKIREYNLFMRATEQYIADTHRIFQYLEAGDKEGLGHIFRNLHSIKGLARNYGFDNISSMVHQAEEHFQNTRDGKINFDKEFLLHVIRTVELEIINYRKLATEKLGRLEEQHQVVIDDHVIDAWYRKGKKTLSQLPLSKQKEDLQRIFIDIKKTYTSTLNDLIREDVLANRKLASELGKNLPFFNIRNGNIFIQKEKSALLKSIFIHLIRNAIDHGIETPQERLAAGKEETGNILIRIEDHPNSSSMFRIVFADDGRGANIIRLREIGRNLGILDDDETDQNKILSIMFVSGVSTTTSISEISGRGVGMDAVKNLLIEQGGQVTVEALSKSSPALTDGTGAIRLVPKAEANIGFQTFEIYIDLPRSIISD